MYELRSRFDYHVEASHDDGKTWTSAHRPDRKRNYDRQGARLYADAVALAHPRSRVRVVETWTRRERRDRRGDWVVVSIDVSYETAGAWRRLDEDLDTVMEWWRRVSAQEAQS